MKFEKRSVPVGWLLALGALSVCAGYIGSASANSNPLIRACVLKNADFETLNTGSLDDLPMCRFGMALMGAQAVQDVISGTTDQAVSAFLASQPTGDPSSACSAVGADEVTGTSEQNGLSFDVCRFSDGSIVDAQTLARGAQDPQNAALRQAL
jgi:hypothetical protein